MQLPTMSLGLCPYSLGQMFYLMVHDQGHLGYLLYVFVISCIHLDAIIFPTYYSIFLAQVVKLCSIEVKVKGLNLKHTSF